MEESGKIAIPVNLAREMHRAIRDAMERLDNKGVSELDHCLRWLRENLPEEADCG